MTNQQGAPEALRLADEWQRKTQREANRQNSAYDHYGMGNTPETVDPLGAKMASELRRLAALVEAQQPTTHVQNPAAIEHVAGDVSKNGPESNMAQQPAPSAAAAGGLPIAQEPKYTVTGAHIVNRATGEAVPHDEPVFVFRARDALGVRALEAYLALIGEREPSSAHADAVRGRIADFQHFAAIHPERMKWPDTSPTPQADSQPAQHQPDVEGEHARLAIAIYSAATGGTESEYCRLSTSESLRWERAALAAREVCRDGVLFKIQEVVACAGQDWPDVPGEPEVLRRVKALARMAVQQTDSQPAPVEELDDDACRCEPSDYVRPADYDGDGSVAAMARRAARAPADSVTAPAGEPIAWESTTLGYKKYLTQSGYEMFSPAVRAWYKPYKCSNCTTPQPTQAQAGAVPLTDEQIAEGFAKRSRHIGLFAGGVRFAEQHHGIKGGQHGADK